MANNYKGRKIHSYSSNFKKTLLTALIKDAEKVEKQRFTEICNKDTGMNVDFESWLSVYPNWKQEYKNLLRTKTSNPLSKKQKQELEEITEQLTKDIIEHEKNIKNIIAMGLTEIELQKNDKYNRSIAFKGGLEIEKNIVTDKYSMIKNLDTKAIFRETQGNWRAELAGDYSWSFNKSQLEHWGEVKSNLDDFHITGSKDLDDEIFIPIINKSNISYNIFKNEYTISVPVAVKEEVGKKLLLRKYNLYRKLSCIRISNGNIIM